MPLTWLGCCGANGMPEAPANHPSQNLLWEPPQGRAATLAIGVPDAAAVWREILANTGIITDAFGCICQWRWPTIMATGKW